MLNWKSVSPKALAVAVALTLTFAGITPLRADGKKGKTNTTTTTTAKAGNTGGATAENEVENENENNNNVAGNNNEAENEPGGGNGGGTTAASGNTGGGGNGTEVRLRARGVGAGVAGAAPELSGDFRSRGTEVRLQGELENLTGFAVGSQITFCLTHATTTTALATSLVELEAGVNVAEFNLESKNGATVPAVQAGDVLAAFSGATCGAGTAIASGTFQ